MKATQITGAAPKVKTLVSGLLFATLTCTSLSWAHASLLGEVINVSAVGEPLLIELRSPGNTPEQAAECIRVFAAPAKAPGLEVVANAQVSVHASGQNARLIVRRSTPAFEPIIQLTLLNICDPRMQRAYTLFLEPPVGARVSRAGTAAPRAPAKAGAGSGPVWSTMRGESLGSIAQALYPNDRAARRHFVNEVMRANPERFGTAASVDAPLPPGAELRIPDLARKPPRSAASRPASNRVAKSERGIQAAPAAPPTGRAASTQAAAVIPIEQPGRLVLEGDQTRDLNAAPAPTPLADGASGDDPLAQREALLVAAIDQTIKTQLELMDRLRRLEEVQASLKEQLEAGKPAPTLVVTPHPVAAPLVATPDAIPSRDLPADAPAATGEISKLMMAAAASLVLLAALLVARRRRRDAKSAPIHHESTRPEVSAWPEEAPTTVGERTAIAAADVQEPRKPTKTIAPLDFETGMEISSPEAETLPPVTMADEPVEEHDSAVELADIMISFGRVHGAAETLADFIRSNPRQAVTPWLKLMEVYRMAGMRMEFDALARQLNKTFNVKAVTWDNFDEARKPVYSLEQMPHLIDLLTKSWGTRECQAFLEKLLRDNRDGLREGFPISIIDEILTLESVLEERIGRYRPDPAA